MNQILLDSGAEDNTAALFTGASEIKTVLSCLTLRINKPFLILKCNWKNMRLVRVTTGCGEVFQFTALTAS